MSKKLKDYGTPQAPWKKKLHDIIYEADTPSGKWFDIILLIFILISVILVMLESVNWMSEKYARLFYISEWIITIFFTIEYILRIVTIKQPKKYIFSFLGIVDFISTIPLYLSMILSGANVLLAVRALRLLRIFRILKVTRYVSESNKLVAAIKSSGPKIAVFLFAVIILSIISGTLMYLIEGAESGFTSIPKSIYWCIVTLTTVGFGDIAPVTPLGQLLATVIMIMGYGIIAVPTGIVSAEYTKTDKQPHMNTSSCNNCGESKHRDNSEYCHKCGDNLNE